MSKIDIVKGNEFRLILGLGISAVVLTGIFIPLTTPLVLTGVSMTSIVPLFWGGGRCSWSLYDRSVHDQPIGDLESVPLWLGTAAAMLGRDFSRLPGSGLGRFFEG